MTDPDIIDRIDALVDEQLAEGEHASDYLTGDHKYPRCPHCGRHWHGLPITERIATMYDIGRIDPEYTLAEDDSPVVCEGSDFIGPQRAPAGDPGIWLPNDDGFGDGSRIYADQLADTIAVIHRAAAIIHDRKQR